jgi:hypothetical protein
MKLWTFYEKAVNDSISAFYCKKPNIQTALINKLYEETSFLEFDGNYKSVVNKWIPETCFKELVPALKNCLESTSSNGLDKEMALNILEAKNQLSSEELDLYATLYLLDGPIVGDKMNTAWKKIENLSENFSKRQKILVQIQNLKFLPDRIFKDPNLPRSKAIINLFAKNFPEYLEYYGKSCLKLLSYSDDTPLKLTSSLQCNEFLKAAKNLNGSNTPWISDSVQSQYSGISKK